MFVSVLGSTGSIGTQTLDVIENLNNNGYNIKIKSLSANRNIKKLKSQIKKFMPDYVCVCYKNLAHRLEYDLKHELNIKNIEILAGSEGLINIAREKVDLLINAIVGFDGMLPTLEAVCAKNDVALANKESLVLAGNLIMSKARENNVKILPIDSEHSAIFQSMQNYDQNDIENVYLTASGGPFNKRENLDNITVKEALNHPTWNMGKKISIDSATMINKGFEIIEAHWLFDLPIEKIKVLVHPQSLIHSMVEFKDGNIIAQLGAPDMRMPIQFAITYPRRVKNNFKRLDFDLYNLLSFEKQNKKLIGIDLCREALNIGGTMPAAVCITNDIMVEKFLNQECDFMDIYKFISLILNKHKTIFDYNIKDIFELKNHIKKMGDEV